MSASLKAATSGGKRMELDFYPTPPLATGNSENGIQIAGEAA